MSDWFDDDAARPVAKKPARPGHPQHQTSDRRLPGVPDPAPTNDVEWDFGVLPKPDDEGERMGRLVASSDDDESARESSENEFAEEASGEDGESDSEHGGDEASVELNRDKFYDGMQGVGNAVGAAGWASGSQVAGGVGKAISGGAFVGKKVGKFLDAAADHADDAAHTRHQNGDMKIINDKKDQQALDKINEGQGKNDSHVTK